MTAVDSASHKTPLSNSRLRIIVLGYLVRGPLGGLTNYHLQYLLGLKLLGHDVYYVEDSDDYPSCYNPTSASTGTDPSYGLSYANRVFQNIGLGERWAYFDAHKSQWHGPNAEKILRLSKKADLLLNIGGSNPIRPWFMKIPVRTFIDLDPVFTQIRHETDILARNRAFQHTAFLSIGENIVRKDTLIPRDGLPWQPTRQPMVLDTWPVTPGPTNGKFTTVMVWDSYPAMKYLGINYGQKSDSFNPYMKLPEEVGPIFQLAIGGSTAPLNELRNQEWLLLDSQKPTKFPWTYQHYIQQSKAEFSVAKHGYVVSRCGWFSDRSLAYLASGRPVLIQETGFSDWLPTGVGVIPFNTSDEAIAGVEEINRRYPTHSQAARELAAEYFDSRKVLLNIIEGVMSLS
jgi:hypothetical protein